METTAIFVMATFVLLVLYWVNQKKRGGAPPGPFGLPIVGYIPFLTSKPYIALQKLAETYGAVFTVQLGRQNVLVLSDLESTKDAFFQDVFIGRPPLTLFKLRLATLETGAFNGLPWKEQRKFSMQLLKNLGFGKPLMENMMMEEIAELLEKFDSGHGKPVVPRTLLSPSVSNNMASLMYGKRYNFEDPVRKMLDRILQESAPEAGQVAWKLFFPGAAKLYAYLGFGNKEKLIKMYREGRAHNLKEIEEHENTLDVNNIRDYIDGYLFECSKRNDPAFCKEVLEDAIVGYFAAGSETVLTTLDWLILAVATYTHVQEKIQSEIDDIIGRERLPSWKDNANMPYTQATIMEMMRWRTIFPVNVLRYTLWDTQLNGYVIPKDTYVIANLWAIHHNPQYWGEDVEEFRPERLLGEDGKFMKSEHLVPFSIGKRACPGESYAKLLVFLYFVAILQKFNVTLPDGATPDIDGDFGLNLAPKTYEVYFNRRY